MSIKVTFEFENEDAAIAFLEGRAQDPGADKPKATRTRKAAAADPVPPPNAAPTAAATAAQPQPKEVIDALCALADIDTPKAKAILAEHGATSFGPQPQNPNSVPLDPKHYAAVLVKLKAALAAPVAGAGLI